MPIILERLFDWTYDVPIVAEYSGSCIVNDFLVLAYYNSISTIFDRIWIELGKVIPIANSNAENIDYIKGKVLSMEVSGDFGIYLLVLDQEKYNVTLLGFSKDKLASSLELFNYTTRELPGSIIPSDPLVNPLEDLEETFKDHPPFRLLLSYPKGELNKNVPGVLLISHLEDDLEKHVGLLIYGFAKFTSDKYEDYSYNPFVKKVSEKEILISTKSDRYLLCNGLYFEDFKCHSDRKSVV